MTRLYLTPFVTGLTRCQTKLGNTTKEPLGNISVQILDFLGSAGSFCLKSNSNSPPFVGFRSRQR